MLSVFACRDRRSADVLRPGRLIVLAVLMCLQLSVAARSTNAAPRKYKLTIYVDEGRGAMVGHVFVELSDGWNKLFYGFYPSEAQEDAIGRLPASILGRGGEIRDDRRHDWDVKRSYSITKKGFEKAVRGIELARSKGQKWWLNQHCGDFAEAVAKTAGVPIDLPFTFDRRRSIGRNRPAVFANYLRQHGGVDAPRAAVRDLPRLAVRDLPRLAVRDYERMPAGMAAMKKLRKLAISACDDGPYLSSEGLSAFLELESEHVQNSHFSMPYAEGEGSDLSGCSKRVYERLVTLIPSSKGDINKEALIHLVNTFAKEGETPAVNHGAPPSTRRETNCHWVTVSLDHRKELWCN
jgi:hypothetical protein